MIRLDDSFDGRAVAVRIGERIEIALAENASTGYRWSLPPARRGSWSPTLRELEETFDAQGHRPGTPGVRCLYFEAAVEGKADLELEYRRSWEKTAKPARTFHLHVTVLGADSQEPGSAPIDHGTG